MFLKLFFECMVRSMGVAAGRSQPAPAAGSPHRHDAVNMIDFVHALALAGSNRSGKDFSFRDLPSGAYSRDVRLFLIPNY
jgi:hypothetical protein